jgi:hypothetical protein
MGPAVVGRRESLTLPLTSQGSGIYFTLMPYLALLLLLAASGRQYFPVSIANLAAGRNFHTHVRVTGKVVLVKHEADGDLHIRLSDGKHFIVAECIPELPCREPRIGETVTVEGISRFDGEHKWWEVNLVEHLTP